jgi:hypothetical protein
MEKSKIIVNVPNPLLLLSNLKIQRSMPQIMEMHILLRRKNSHSFVERHREGMKSGTQTIKKTKDGY